MPKQTHRLKALDVTRAKVPGMYPDGDGLYLQVTGPDSKSWIYRYSKNGAARWLGLGSARDGMLSLSDARAKRDQERAKILSGIDPVEIRRHERASRIIEAVKALTFEEAAEKYIASHEETWKHKNRVQWKSSLAACAYPIIGPLPVAAIDTALVLKVIEPIWTTVPETASRVRGRVETVLNWATARGHRKGENPARWKGHLSNLLPERSKVRAVKHFAALPYADIAAFIKLLREEQGIGARALELTILTALRTSEVLGAKWNEFDLAAKVWTISAERMKAAREHRVPLSAAALAVLSKLPREPGAEFLFPGAKRGKPLSPMLMLNMLEQMGRTDLTVHGFRSTFRDWAAETTAFPNHVIEMALAHSISNAVEAAYRRGDLFEKRRRLMAAWADYCGIGNAIITTGTVVRLKA